MIVEPVLFSATRSRKPAMWAGVMLAVIAGDAAVERATGLNRFEAALKARPRSWLDRDRPDDIRQCCARPTSVP